MEYSKEDLMEAKKQIWGVGENMGTEESKKIWEENAQFWDNAMGDESNEFHREVVRPKVTELLSPNPADYILDIACGNGNYSSYLAQRGASVVAFDYSKKMIELAKRRQSQYILTETVVKEVRYRTETQTGTRTVTDPDTGETSTEEYEYEVEVPYDYYICTVTLENFNLSHVPVYIMDEETLSAYSLYMSTLGNRPDLFSGSQYPHASTLKEPTYYDVPPEALEDEQFAAMLKEAEKYIGYPYVWGGSSPSTSFDCSGFISWVINHSGWNVGRLGAQGLYNICTPVSSSQAKPGDLVFFVGTYDTPGVSHVGLYVGNSVMLHCGDPISYTNLNSNYWQSHFYSFGRLP